MLEGEIPQKFESWSDYKIILNKAAMKAMGYARMEDAFVRSESPLWITLNEKGEMEKGGTKLMPVVAVIDDYYPAHLTQGVKPMAFVVGKEDNSGDFIIATKPGKEKEVMELLRKIEKKHTTRRSSTIPGLRMKSATYTPKIEKRLIFTLSLL